MALTEIFKIQCVFDETMQGKFMDIPKNQKPPKSNFDWERFLRYVVEAYGSLEQPKYFFSRRWFEEPKYPEMLDFIKENYQFSEDTEPNADVSYSFVLKKGEEGAVMQVSFVGPYFYLSKILPDGSPSLPEEDLSSRDFRFSMLKYMREAGFIFTHHAALSKKILFGGESVSVYSILYCYEYEPSWVA
ncbi:hypothetical protein FEP90_05193 [Burkholderia multivorans]|nr:hypothetical protein [Burkholderia multivorans]MDR8769304.1 hypothetical protein [Burkholderia multivorans]MDR8774676.1 hypothetical protein [Burkholderia multivorans]MDR8792992.1 hypothetical protein [Burkholderia multivorans]MDR8798826.1 hypothetical protein [Burkholderia multivorans]